MSTEPTARFSHVDVEVTLDAVDAHAEMLVARLRG